MEIKEVNVEQLKWVCNPDDFKFETTKQIEVKDKILGQDRAIKAIQLGLDINSPGYNIFVVGHQGTGRTSSVKVLLEERKKQIQKFPTDIIYVYNFKSPDSPKVIEVPSGKGNKFKRDMNAFIDTMKTAIPNLFESESYKERKNEIINSVREKSNEIFKKFESEAKEQGFTLIQVQSGTYTRPDLAPFINDKTVSWQELDNLVNAGKYTQEDYEKLQSLYIKLTDKLNDVYKEIRALERKTAEKLEKLDKDIVTPMVNDWIDELGENYRNKDISEYLKDATNYLLENIKRVLDAHHGNANDASKKDEFLEYQVNVIVDNSELKAPPVIIETSPSYHNLFGLIEKIVEPNGRVTTNHMMIKAGSLIRANGGFIVMNILDVLQEPIVWATLKRTLRNRCVEIQNYEFYNMFSVSSIKPESIKIEVKVIIISNYFIYNLLYHQDLDLKKIFKIMAEFDYVMDNNKENRNHYAQFVRKVVQSENLLDFDRSGVARLVEYGIKLAGKQNKLSTQFNDLADIVREATYWAKKMDDTTQVTMTHVDKAIEEKTGRVNLIEEKIKNSILENDILISVEGEKIGQVNGLAVYSINELFFGKPSRITAKTSVGKLGIINIEREAYMSGPTHDKGVMIITGYLKNKYAQDKPLAVDASIAFEQSYSGVDGDSASSTEIYAILSSLSGLAIKQYIAVTGSVNQNGEIQPIGGVNEKIEGFFDICKERGLTGKQGVMIPYQNIDNLMLNKDVIEAVRNNKFHIYPVKNIDNGIEILTGVIAGNKDDVGNYSLESSVNYLVDKKLKEFAEKYKEYGI